MGALRNGGTDWAEPLPNTMFRSLCRFQGLLQQYKDFFGLPILSYFLANLQSSNGFCIVFSDLLSGPRHPAAMLTTWELTWIT